MPQSFNMSKLSDEIHSKIEELCDAGNEFIDEEQFSEALEQYWAAWDLLPEPKTNWEAATWILTAIGDINFLTEDFEEGKNNLSNVMHCPDAIGNPFIHLRLGQCHYELGNKEKSKDELARAYMGGGKEIFENDDSKYFNFVKSFLKAAH